MEVLPFLVNVAYGQQPDILETAVLSLLIWNFPLNLQTLLTQYFTKLDFKHWKMIMLTGELSIKKKELMFQEYLYKQNLWSLFNFYNACLEEVSIGKWPWH